MTISKRITTLEMKELNERQRAEHSVRMYEQQKKVLQGLDDRNKELEEKFSEVLTYFSRSYNCIHIKIIHNLALDQLQCLSDVHSK